MRLDEQGYFHALSLTNTDDTPELLPGLRMKQEGRGLFLSAGSKAANFLSCAKVACRSCGRMGTSLCVGRH